MTDHTPYIIAAYAIAGLTLTSLTAYAALRLQMAQARFRQEQARISEAPASGQQS